MGPGHRREMQDRRGARGAAAAVVFAALAVAATCPAGEPMRLQGAGDEISYSVGYQVGGDFRRQGVELNADALVRGIRDATAGGEPLMSRKEMSRTLVDLKRKVDSAEKKTRSDQVAAAVAEGEAFLSENGRKPGVVTLPSGLQYLVVENGSGKSPGPADNVTVRYKGTLIDGTEFDSSYRKGAPANFRMESLLPGLREALPRMTEGARWRLFVPASLAFGERTPLEGRTVIFDVELVSVNPAEQAAPHGLR